MKKSKATLILSILFSIHSATAQTNLSWIEEQYAQLDSSLNISNLRDAIISSYDLEDITPTEDDIKERYGKIKKDIDRYRAMVVLWFDIDSARLYADSSSYLLLQDSTFNFEIHYYNRMFAEKFSIHFYQGQSISYEKPEKTRWKYAKLLRAAYKRVLKKKPKYVLRTHHWHSVLLYVKDDRIFVDHFARGEVYELDDYVKKFRHTDSFILPKGYVWVL